MSEALVKVSTERGVFAIREQSAREYAATLRRAPLRLPASWYEPGVAEAMADWIERFDSE